jgi:hypothetical protein
VKTEQSSDEIINKVKEQATSRYKVKAIVERYIESIEEVINIPELMRRFDVVLELGKGTAVIEEIVLQSRIEFNVEVEVEEEDIL